MSVSPGGFWRLSPRNTRVRGFRRPRLEDRAGDLGPLRLGGKRGHPAAQCQSPKADGRGVGDYRGLAG